MRRPQRSAGGRARPHGVAILTFPCPGLKPDRFYVPHPSKTLATAVLRGVERGGGQSTGARPATRRARRQLPPGWRIVEGMGRAATVEVDPVIEQTCELAHTLFAASLVGGPGFHRWPSGARVSWLNWALRRGDAALCRIIERMDDDTFDDTWRALVRRLEARGTEATIEWFRRRQAYGSGKSTL